jgi:hypothetical protein
MILSDLFNLNKMEKTMRRSASEAITNLEQRIARLERKSDVVKLSAMNFEVSQKEVVKEAIRGGLEIREDWTDRDGVRLVAGGSISPHLTLLVSDKNVTLQSVDPRTGRFESLNRLPLQTGIALSRMVSLMIKQSR